MTHAINSSTNLLSKDYITRMHIQMRKSTRGEKDSGKEMRRDRDETTNLTIHKYMTRRKKKEEKKRKSQKEN